jgi:hypothetical protein
MGKDWDKALPPKEAFREMLRVLKPGALAFVMSSPRQDVLWRMLAMLEEVGFELRQSFISWIYKTGFPKAYDVSKGIENRLRGDLIRLKIDFFLKQKNFTLQQLVKQINIPDAKKTLWDWLYDSHNPSEKNWQKFKEILGVSKEEEKQFEREVIGKKTKLNSFSNGYGVGKTGYQKIELPITRSLLEQAKQWEGWKSISGLKPALECILMVNKPMSEPTIVDNVLRWGVGAINVDACRIPYQTDETPTIGGRHNIEGSRLKFGGEPVGTIRSQEINIFQIRVVFPPTSSYQTKH